MFSLAKAHDYTIKEILTLVPDIDIFAYYIKDLKIRKAIHSPLREDNKPSFAIFPVYNNYPESHPYSKISFLFMDYATGEAGNCFTFVSKLFGCKLNEAVNIIVNDIILKSTQADLYIRAKETQKELEEFITTVKQDTEIDITEREWNGNDIAFWNKFGINKQQLITFKVKPTHIVYIHKEPRLITVDKNPIYAYTQLTNPNRMKIYRPKATEMKWISNTKKTDILGLDGTTNILKEKQKLLKDETLKFNYIILTKSLKDVLTLNSLGHPAIAPQSEMVVPEETINTAYNLAHQIIILFDNDETGINATKKIVTKYQLEYIEIPKCYNAKDISDMYLEQGKLKTKDFLNSNIYKAEQRYDTKYRNK